MATSPTLCTPTTVAPYLAVAVSTMAPLGSTLTVATLKIILSAVPQGSWRWAVSITPGLSGITSSTHSHLLLVSVHVCVCGGGGVDRMRSTYIWSAVFVFKSMLHGLNLMSNFSQTLILIMSDHVQGWTNITNREGLHYELTHFQRWRIIPITT